MALTQIQNAMTQLLGNSSGALSIDGSGNVGIGNSSQTQAKLLSYPSANQVGIMVYGNGTAGYPAFGFAGQVTSNGGRGAGMYLPEDGVLAWSTGGSERMRIDSSGNVGIGTSSPAYLQHNYSGSENAVALALSSISNSNTAGSLGLVTKLRIGSSSSLNNNGVAEIRGLHNLYSNSLSALTFLTNDGTSLAERLRLDSSGNLGLGVTPSYRLDVQAAANNTTIASFSGSEPHRGLRIATYANLSGNDCGVQFLGPVAGYSAFKWTLGSTDAMTLDASGRLGIGTSSPDSSLHITGSSLSNAATSIGIRAGMFSGGYAAIEMVSSSGLSGWIDFHDTAGDDYSERLRGGAGQFELYTNKSASARMLINSSGYVGIGTTSPDSILSVAGRQRLGSMYYYGVTGYKDSTASAFDMFDITGLAGQGYLKVNIGFFHAGGGQHGSVREFTMVLNAYTDVNTPISTEQSFNGGGGFTISRPSNDKVRIRWNGATVFSSSYYMFCTIESNYAFGVSNVGLTNFSG